MRTHSPGAALCGAAVGLVVFAVAHAAHGQPVRAPRQDVYGDPLPAGAVLRLGTKRLQTKGGFGWLPDGKALATYRDGTIFVWDMEDGHCCESLLAPIKVNPFYTYGTTFIVSRDGERLVCAGHDGSLCTWNLQTSDLASLPAAVPPVTTDNRAVALHPSGKEFVTLRASGELEFRDFATCQVRRGMKLAQTSWREGAPAAFSPDGKTLALGDTRASAIYLIDAEKEAEPIVIRKAHANSMAQSFGFLGDGRLYTVGTRREKAGDDKPDVVICELLLWDLKQQPPTSRRWPLEESQPEGFSVAFSSDGAKMVSIHRDRIEVWDAAEQRIVRSIEKLHIRNTSSAIASIDPTSKFVAVDDRMAYVRIWDLATGQPHLSTERHHQGHLLSANWSPDGGRIATGDGRGEVRVWDAHSGRGLIRFRGPEWGTFALGYSPDGQQIVLCGDQPGPWDPKVGREANGLVRWHDASTGNLVREQAIPQRARLLVPSGDQRFFAVASVSGPRPRGPIEVYVLDAATGERRGMFTPDSEPVTLSWSEDNETLLTATGTHVVRTSVKSMQTIDEVKLPHWRVDRNTGFLVEDRFNWAVFQRHSAGLITANDSEIHAWKLPSGEKLWTIKTAAKYVRTPALSPDGHTLAVATTSAEGLFTLRLLDLAGRNELAQFDLGRDQASFLRFSPDGNQVLAGFSDGTALVYDVSNVR